MFHLKPLKNLIMKYIKACGPGAFVDTQRKVENG